MPDELLCTALARSIAVRLPLASHDELRAVDIVLQTLEAIRHGDGRDWFRRVATGPGDVDRSYHLARRLRATITTACGGSWPIDDAVEVSPNPPLVERCDACWREAAASSPGGPAVGEALLFVVAELAERDRERAGLREAARVEMLGADPPRPRRTLTDAARRRLDEHRDRAVAEGIATAPAGMYKEAAVVASKQHLTRLDSTSAVIALAEVPRDRDEEIEVDIETEWDLGDVGGGT